jgi:hypothetical protein
VHITSPPVYPKPLPAARVAARLRDATQTRHHLFVPAGACLFDAALSKPGQLPDHRQVIDALLLGLAVVHGLRRVGFTAASPVRALRAATASQLDVIRA